MKEENTKDVLCSKLLKIAVSNIGLAFNKLLVESPSIS